MRVWYGLFTKLTRVIVAHDFLANSFKLKKDILPPLKNRYFNLKTTSHMKPKIFFWTKLLKNLLLGKCLISVAATSMTKDSVVVEI